MKTQPIELMSLLILVGCSSQEKIDQKIDQKILVEDRFVIGAGEIPEAGIASMLEEESLSDRQRRRLAEIRWRTSREIKQLEVQAQKIRSLLVRDIAAPNISREEIDLLKEKLTDVENQRLALAIDALEDARSVVKPRAKSYDEMIDVDKESTRSRTLERMKQD